MPNASNVINMPITMPIFASALMFHLAGLSDHLTLSVDSDIFTKSVINIIKSNADAVMTNSTIT